MRSLPAGLTELLETPKTLSVRATFRDTRLRFTRRMVDDSLGLSDPSHADVCAYGTGFLRVVNHEGLLYTQYVSDPTAPATFPGNWELWENSGVALKAQSRAGVEGGKVWYQKADGSICYRDYSNFAVEVHVTSAYNPHICSIAPLNSGAYIQFFNGSWLALAFVSDAGNSDWNGRVYGDIQTSRFIDAVEIGDTHYVYYMDRNVGRICEIARIGGHWGSPTYTLPIDAIDTSYGLTLAYASAIDGRVFLTGRLVRSSDGAPIGMDVFTIGPRHFSFGRDLFITEYSVGGKFILRGDALLYVGVNSVLEAPATIIVGVDNPALKLATNDVNSFSFAEGEGRSGKLDMTIPSRINHPAVRRGGEVDFEFGYNGILTRITKAGIDTVFSDKHDAGLSKTITGRSRSVKSLTQFTPDQGIYIPSQARMVSHPSEMDQVIRAKGRFDTTTMGSLSPLRLPRLNEDGVLYSSARASRGGIMRAKFLVPSGGNFSAKYGVGINYYQEDRQEAAERLLIDYDTVTEDQYGDNAILAVCNSNADTLTVYLWTDGAMTPLASAPLVIPTNTWHWLQISFHEGMVRVLYRTDIAAEWTDVLQFTYASAIRTPWKRENLGRGCIYMRNIMPNSATPGFSTGDEIVPINDLGAFPNMANIIVGEVNFAYLSKSPTITASEQLSVYSDPHFKTTVTGFTGFPVAVTPAGLTDNVFIGSALFVEEGAGNGKSYLITGYDAVGPQVWEPTGTYISPDKWQDHVGDLRYGNWTASGVSIVYVSKDPSGILGSDSKVRIMPGLILDKPAETGSSADTVSLYGELSVLCDHAASYSQEMDYSVADALIQISAMAGCRVSCRNEMEGTQSLGAYGVSGIGNNVDFIAEFILPEMIDGDEVGWCFRSIAPITSSAPGSNVGGYKLTVDRSGASYYVSLRSLFDGALIERVKLWFAPAGTIRVSVQGSEFGVWVEGVLAHVFHNSDFTTGEYIGLTSRNAKVVSATLSQVDDLISDIILGTRGDAFSAIGEIIADRKIYFADDQNGDLEFYRKRDDAGALPDIVFTFQSEENDTVISRARLEGILIGEVWDFDALREHGNLYALMNPKYAGSLDSILKEGINSMSTIKNASKVYGVECVIHPGLQSGDVATFTLPSGPVEIKVGSVAMRASLSDANISCGMTIQGISNG